jgi:uncharacterized RDD family membrane protein YckC
LRDSEPMFWQTKTGTAAPCPYRSRAWAQTQCGNVDTPDTVVLTGSTAPRRIRPSNQQAKKSAVRCDGIAQGVDVYCSKCGTNLADNATFCSRCGAQIVAVTPAAVPQGAPAPLATAVPAGAIAGGYAVAQPAVYVQPLPLVTYAGFWLRVLAYLIDMIVLGIFAVPILVGAAMAMGIGGMIESIPHNQDPFMNGMPPAFALFILLCAGLGLFGTWLYFALLESSEWQGTAGKKVLGLIVTDLAGQRVTFLRATGRHFAKIVTGLIPFGIGYIMAGFTEKRQALHDMIASCLVLRR